MENIGSQLRESRESRSLSIEDVAHRTRVSARQLRALEENNYSEFASLTYGRYFLSLYSEFLELDTSLFQKEFPDAMLGSSENYAYLQDSTETLRPASRDREPRAVGKKRPAPEVQRRRPATPARTAEPMAPQSHPLLLFGLIALLLGALAYFFIGSEKDSFTGSTYEAPKNVPALLTGPTAPAGDSQRGATDSANRSGAAEAAMNGALAGTPSESVLPAQPSERPSQAPPPPSETAEPTGPVEPAPTTGADGSSGATDLSPEEILAGGGAGTDPPPVRAIPFEEGSTRVAPPAEPIPSALPLPRGYAPGRFRADG